MIQEHPLIDRYVSRFDASLNALDCPDRPEIVTEIRNHIAEARTAGKPLDQILAALGPADVLARAYAVELALNPRDRRSLHAISAFLKVTGVIAASSIATLIVVGVLGSIGIGFSISGLTMLVVGVLEASNIHLPGVRMNGIPPIWVILASPLLLIAGVGALLTLRLYVRFLGRSLRKLLPRVSRLSPVV